MVFGPITHANSHLERQSFPHQLFIHAPPCNPQPRHHATALPRHLVLIVEHTSPCAWARSEGCTLCVRRARRRFSGDGRSASAKRVTTFAATKIPSCRNVNNSIGASAASAARDVCDDMGDVVLSFEPLGIASGECSRSTHRARVQCAPANSTCLR